MLRILIADDHPLLRVGIRQIVEKNFEVDAIDEATTGQEMIDKVRHHHYNAELIRYVLEKELLK